MNNSAGHLKPSDLRGRVFSFQAISSSSSRAKLVQAAKFAGIGLKQTFIKEGRELRRKAGGYAHAKQFKRLRRTVKRQRTILVLR